MVKYIPFTISVSEKRLIEAMIGVQHGELFGVEIDDEPPTIGYDLHPAQKDLILYIRDGCQYIDILTVHHGLPALAEIDYMNNGFRCRKKVKFPTE